MPTTPVHDWGDAMMTSLTGALAMFLGAIPRVIGFLVILLIGWFVASLIAKGVAALLRAVHFDDVARRSGFAGFVAKMGVHTDAAGFISLVALWFVRLIVLVVAFDALGLPAVSDVLRQLLLWLPNLVVALVVLVIGGLIASAVSHVVRGATAEAGFSNPNLLGRLAAIAIWAFAIVVAVNQIGIAGTLINTLFMAFVGAIALAMGLAFGLGGRDTASQIVRNWYDRAHAIAPKLEQAAESASNEVKRETARTAEERDLPVPSGPLQGGQPAD